MTTNTEANIQSSDHHLEECDDITNSGKYNKSNLNLKELNLIIVCLGSVQRKATSKRFPGSIHQGITYKGASSSAAISAKTSKKKNFKKNQTASRKHQRKMQWKDLELFKVAAASLQTPKPRLGRKLP